MYIHALSFGITVLACGERMFKPSSGNELCQPCPDNSNNAGTANVGCSCNEGYRRVNPDDVTTACSGMCSLLSHGTLKSSI